MMKTTFILILIVIFLMGCDAILLEQHQIRPKTEFAEANEIEALFSEVKSVLIGVEKECGRYVEKNAQDPNTNPNVVPSYHSRHSGLSLFYSDQIVIVDVFVWNPGCFISTDNRRFVNKVSQALWKAFPEQVYSTNNYTEHIQPSRYKEHEDSTRLTDAVD